MRSAPVFLLAFALLWSAGCKSALAPEQSAIDPPPTVTPDDVDIGESPSQNQVPVLAGLTTTIENGQWVLRATLIPRNPNPFYSVHQAGGWSMQVFFDTDQQPTGYAGAYEFEMGWWGDEVEPFV